jgi:flagellin-specific chaperone FliS
MMNTFYYDEQVRALEKQFARDYETYLQSQIEGASNVRALQYLMREVYSNTSTWSGGNSLKNYEEQTKREIVVHMMRDIINELAYMEEKNEHV